MRLKSKKRRPKSKNRQKLRRMLSQADRVILSSR